MKKNFILKTLFGASLCFAGSVSAIQYVEGFNSLNAAIEFCEENHCLSVDDVYGRELLPLRLLLVTYDNSLPGIGCKIEDNSNGVVCRDSGGDRGRDPED